MKLSNIRFALTGSLAILSLFVSVESASAIKPQVNSASKEWIENQAERLPSGLYLVIGVFEYEKNARRMVDNARQEGLEADYTLYPSNGYYYVYTSNTEEKEQIMEAYSRVRNSTSFHDAWVFIVENDQNTNFSAGDNSSIASLQPFDAVLGPEKSYNQEEKPVPQQEVEEVQKNTNPVLVVNTMSRLDNKPVEASIELVDGLRAKLIEKIASGSSWLVENKDELDTVLVVSEALGYRKMQLEYIPNQPINDTTSLYTQVEKDTVYLQMDLIELQKGDFQILYNTYFYGNSTVMREQSRYELDKLFNIMQDKPDMRIKLHGHTNGNSRGVAYLFDEKEKNYFEIFRTKDYTKRAVTSKKLSAYRAETIKSFLINKGIEPKRVETHGWGGKKLLYDIDSPLAKNNIRVEIEVLNK